MHGVPGLRTGDRYLPLPLSADHAIGRNGKLQNHMRAFFQLACEVTRKRSLALFAQQACFHDNARLPQDGVTATGNTLVRVVNRHNDTGDAVFDQRIGAGRRLAQCEQGSRVT